jgi:hypothetical protein
VSRVYGGWGQWRSLNEIRRGRGGGRNSGDAMIFGDRFSCCRENFPYKCHDAFLAEN